MVDLRHNNASEDSIHMQCPRCGAPFTVKPSVSEGLCFNCGCRMELKVMRRDAAAVTHGYASYAALIDRAKQTLNAADYVTAAQLYANALEAAPDDYAARWGVLMSKTSYLSEVMRHLPRHEYESALVAAPPEEVQALTEAWAKYENLHRQYWEGQRRAAEEKRARRKERAVEEAARQKREQEAAHTSAEAARNEKEPRRHRPFVRYLLIGAGAVLAVLGLAACAVMGGGGRALFFIIALGAMGSANRRNNHRGD